MRRFALVGALVMTMMLVAAPMTQAKGPKLPKVTAGGVTLNANSGEPVVLLNVGGFSGIATGAGTATTHSFFGNDIVVYPAKGQVQTKFVLESDPSVKLGSLHGSVVCIADFGPSSEVDGGGDPDGHIWEVRFQITKADDPAAVGLYGSYLVQDNGKVDYADESFAAALVLNPDCGNVAFFQMEDHLKGNIKVK